MPILKKPWNFQYAASTYNFTAATAVAGGYIASGIGSINIGSANVMGAIVTAFTSAQVTFPVSMFRLMVSLNAVTSGQINNMLMDMMIDTGSGWTTALPSISSNINFAQQTDIIEHRFSIPQNAAIGFCAQIPGATNNVLRLAMEIFGGPNDPTQFSAPQGIEVIGANRASTFGISFTPNTNAISIDSATWQTLGPLTYDTRALRLVVLSPNTSAVSPTSGISFQLGVGSNPLAGFPVGGKSQTSAESMGQSAGLGTYQASLPAGTVLLIRARTTNTTAVQPNGAIVYAEY